MWRDYNTQSILEDELHKAIIKKVANKYECAIYEKEFESSVLYEKCRFVRKTLSDAKKVIEQSEEFKMYFDKEEIEARTIYRKGPMKVSTFSPEKAYHGKTPYWVD